KVTITYHDTESFTVEEVVKQAVHNYGKQAHIEVMPDSTIAYDHIYFGLQQLITHEQLSLLYDKSGNYHQELEKLRAQIVFKTTEIIDQVIVDNESKVG
ncbi:MAG: hypothetical protein ACK5S6_00760, partial [bacterium]